MGLLLALSGFNRSNALLNIGFVAYKAAKKISHEISMYGALRQIDKHELSTTIANIIGDAIFPAVFCTFAALAPFALFQWYGYTLFCGLTKMNLHYDQVIIDYAHNHSLKLPSHEPSEWCFNYIPLAYSYVQSHYWGVGLLQYFSWRQIPNFVLAAPMLALVLSQAYKFFQHHKKYCLRLGLTSDGSSANNFDTYGAKTLPKEAFVYVVHGAFLALFALFCIHVQVATRLIASSSPVIYWWMAVLTTPKERKPLHKHSESLKYPRLDVLSHIESAENMQSHWKNLVLDERPSMPKIGVWSVNYFVSYACIGCVLFANFLPWT